MTPFRTKLSSLCWLHQKRKHALPWSGARTPGVLLGACHLGWPLVLGRSCGSLARAERQTGWLWDKGQE